MKDKAKQRRRWFNALQTIPALGTFGPIFLWLIIQEAARGRSLTWIDGMFVIGPLLALIVIFWRNIILQHEEINDVRAQLRETSARLGQFEEIMKSSKVADTVEKMTNEDQKK